MGGSESRFVMGPWEDSNREPQRCLMAKSHSYGSKIVLGDRNVSDRYQKFRIQTTDKGAYIRFDNHPQPGIRVKDDKSVELYNASWDAAGEWALSVVAEWRSGLWELPSDKAPSLKADDMKKIGRLRVVVYNMKYDAFLACDNSGNVIVKNIGPLNPENEELKNGDFVRKHNILWELNYTNSQWSADEVTIAVTGPAEIAALIGAWAAAPLVGPALFAAFGFAAVPVLQVIGGAALSEAGATSMALVTKFSREVMKIG